MMTNEEILAAAGVTREWCGQWVRREWVAWARVQPGIREHPGWTVPWAELGEPDREACRLIGGALFCAGWRACREQSLRSGEQSPDVPARLPGVGLLLGRAPGPAG